MDGSMYTQRNKQINSRTTSSKATIWAMVHHIYVSDRP